VHRFNGTRARPVFGWSLSVAWLGLRYVGQEALAAARAGLEDGGMQHAPGVHGGRLTRQEVSDAVSGLGWRFVLGVVRTHVQVRSLAQAAQAAAGAVAVAGQDGGRLSVDLRADRVVLTLQTPGEGWITARDVEAAGQITAAMTGLGLATDPDVGGAEPRSVQLVWIAIDALDIALIRPFWKAVMGYGDQAGESGPDASLADPLGRHPTIWFQQMDAPRPQRNRIHLDISVPHDEASARVQAVLAAGGTMRDAAEAPACWVLADAEGNEACITTWQGSCAPTARAWGVLRP
jgi:4a-hydroxytetrahydrobiopterin dehydratase